MAKTYLRQNTHNRNPPQPVPPGWGTTPKGNNMPKYYPIRTAEELLEKGLTGDDLEDAFGGLDLDEQDRYLDLVEGQLPWTVWSV